MNKKQVKAILARYEEIQPKNGTRVTPRNGFYLIQEIFDDAKYVNFYRAWALWKEHDHEDFHEAVNVCIGLASLAQTSPEGKDFDPLSVLNKIVKVTTTFDGKIQFKGRETECVLCSWAFDDSPYNIKRNRASFFDTLPEDGPIFDFVAQFEPADEHYGDDETEGFNYGNDYYEGLNDSSDGLKGGDSDSKNSDEDNDDDNSDNPNDPDT